jgi:O-antigen/teichoic acid export membrane protein
LVVEYLKIAYIQNRFKSLSNQIKNLSLYLLATLITSLTGILINPFMAINLSPKDYAIIGYFTSFNSLVLYLISFSFISFYSRKYYLIREDERQKVLDTLLLSQLLLGLLVLLFVLFGFYLYMYLLKVSFPFYPYALVCFIPVYFSCFYNFLLVDKRMKRQALSFFKITAIFAILGAILAILFVVILKKGAIGRLWSILIPMVGMGIYSFFKLLSEVRFSRKILRDAISFGWPISLSAILYYFLSGIDRAMLEQQHDNYSFGIYNVAIQIAVYLSVFYTAISQTFEPDIYKTIVENNRKKLIIIVLFIIILNSIPTLLFIVFAHPIVNILTHGRYTESTIFAQILAVKNIPMAFCFLISNIIIGYGYPKIELVNRVIGAILSIILFKFLIEKYGFFGAAWGQSLAYVLMTTISLFFIVYKIIAPNRSHV